MHRRFLEKLRARSSLAARVFLAPHGSGMRLLHSWSAAADTDRSLQLVCCRREGSIPVCAMCMQHASEHCTYHRERAREASAKLRGVAARERCQWPRTSCCMPATTFTMLAAAELAGWLGFTWLHMGLLNGIFREWSWVLGDAVFCW